MLKACVFCWWKTIAKLRIMLAAAWRKTPIAAPSASMERRDCARRKSAAFDIVVLDVMLPLLDGFEVTRRLRAENNPTPILLLTGRDAERDVVRGLDAGADDYLTNPFSFEVLLARLRARTRAQSGERTKLTYADLMIDLDRPGVA